MLSFRCWLLCSVLFLFSSFLYSYEAVVEPLSFFSRNKEILGAGSLKVVVERDAQTVTRIARITDMNFHFLTQGCDKKMWINYAQSLLPDNTVEVKLQSLGNVSSSFRGDTQDYLQKLLRKGYIDVDSDIMEAGELCITATLGAETFDISAAADGSCINGDSQYISSDERNLFRKAFLGLRFLEQALLADQPAGCLLAYHPVLALKNLVTWHFAHHECDAAKLEKPGLIAVPKQCEHSGVAYNFSQYHLFYTTAFQCCEEDGQFNIGFKTLLTLRRDKINVDQTLKTDIKVPANLAVILINAAILKAEFQQKRPFYELDAVIAVPGVCEFLCREVPDYSARQESPDSLSSLSSGQRSEQSATSSASPALPDTKCSEKLIISSEEVDPDDQCEALESILRGMPFQ